MASPITAFQDFMNATREEPLSGIEDILNEATRRRKYLLRLMLSGMADEELLQGGESIVDEVQLQTVSSFQFYQPGQDFEPTITPSLTPLTVGWRFCMVNSAWMDQEVLLNSGDLVTRFKNLKKAKEQAMMTDLYDGIETGFWATPDTAQMEAAGGTQPYSLGCFITENGLAPSSTNGGVTGADWSTIETASPASFANWRNQFETYDNSSSANAILTLGNSLALMWEDVQFESPVSSQQYFNDTQLEKLGIFTSRAGKALLLSATQSHNNRIVDLGFQNGTLTYAGIPIRVIGALDEKTYTSGPRFWFINFNRIKPIFHKARYFEPIDRDGGPTQPEAHVTYRATWYNLFCKSRREQGIVLPAA